MEEILLDEKEECSQTSKSHRGERNSDTSTIKTRIAEAVVETVKLVKTKDGYGFVTRSDTREDVFVYRSTLTTQRRLGKFENILYDVILAEK